MLHINRSSPLTSPCLCLPRQLDCLEYYRQGSTGGHTWFVMARSGVRSALQATQGQRSRTPVRSTRAKDSDESQVDLLADSVPDLDLDLENQTSFSVILYDLETTGLGKSSVLQSMTFTRASRAAI